MKTLLHNLREFLIAVDQAMNVLVCALTLRKGWSDETLSAHCFRSWRDGKVWGRLLMPPIDALFFWQKPDSAFVGADGEPIKSHCERAYAKEKARDYLPPEYRDPPPSVGNMTN